MKNKVLICTLSVLLLTGCGKTIPTLSDGSEAVVKFSDGSMISINELYDELKSSYATNTIIEIVDKKILEEKYKDDLDDAKSYADNYIKSLKNYYVDDKGNYSESKLLSDIQRSGYSSIDDFKENVRINYLRNKAIEEYAESLVTEKEIEKYYKDEIVGDREVYHIEIIPEVTDKMTSDEKKAKEEEALNEAKSIIAKLKKGEKFEDLAKEHSDDDATKEKGGNLGFINKGTYGSDEFDKEVYNLSVGDYSKTPVKTSKGYEIVMIKSEKDKKELDDVKTDIIETLGSKKLSEDATLQVTAMTELRKENGFEIIDSEIDKNYKKYINDLMQSARSSNAE